MIFQTTKHERLTSFLSASCNFVDLVRHTPFFVCITGVCMVTLVMRDLAITHLYVHSVLTKSYDFISYKYPRPITIYTTIPLLYFNLYNIIIDTF